MSREEESEGTGPEGPWGPLKGGAPLEDSVDTSEQRSSLVLLQTGDPGELPTAQPHRAAVVGRGSDAGDICTGPALLAIGYVRK